jgi:hypothetical protein
MGGQARRSCFFKGETPGNLYYRNNRPGNSYFPVRDRNKFKNFVWHLFLYVIGDIVNIFNDVMNIITDVIDDFSTFMLHDFEFIISIRQSRLDAALVGI